MPTAYQSQAEPGACAWDSVRPGETTGENTKLSFVEATPQGIATKGESPSQWLAQQRQGSPGVTASVSGLGNAAFSYDGEVAGNTQRELGVTWLLGGRGLNIDVTGPPSVTITTQDLTALASQMH